MPKKSLGDKLERQVENVKTGLKDVAQKLTEPDPEPRIGLTPSRPGNARTTGRAPSKEELYADAKRLGVKGRSKMTKEQLAQAVRRSS